jgi:hypothetical protein
MSLEHEAGNDQGRGEDRRAHPRFSVDEEARMLLVGHGYSSECRVLDLSIEGCRLHSSGRILPALHTRVEITFTINGIPFRVGGTVQRNNGAGELGVRFPDMTDHRRAEWAEIVAEVQQRAAVRAVREAAREAIRTRIHEAARREDP